MDNNKLKKLKPYHVIFLVQNSMVALGLLSLPNELSSMGYSQWWIPLMLGIIANLTLIPIIWLFQRYPQDNLFTLNEKLIGKFLGKILNTFLVVYLIFFIASIVEGYLDLIKIIALPDRTIAGPLVVFFIVLLYIVHGGIKSIARFCILSFFLTIWMAYFLQWSILEGDIRHLMPVSNFTFHEFLVASRNGYFAICGYELIMTYFPYIINQKKAFKHASIGIWITITLYFSVTVVSVMYFTEWQLEEVIYPILKLYKAVELSYAERIDVLGISLWVLLILSSTAAYLWVAKKGMDALRSNNKTYHLYVIAICIFVFVMIPLSKDFQEAFYDNLFYIKFSIILWPNILIFLHLIKSKRKQASA
ncbi:GerAB/ArcD/ProY family transporter [Jeotgalibacillus campisalis]|uniref:Spore germination protein (Amino acid permease) n=1 Tax=Jeotgalibacillus campisalis TaxID=220754 RepID=A0A0C2VQJ6_9BACL|nr:GerAB/ArcD/ProY family transporter [Jeotgalibacillus campisalis]KIL51182.1 spore germination protein (amino acid permease) [Jeotgalibacillus campisalis]